MLGNLFSALFAGLVVGALGRLVVPGRQPIGCLFTVLIGVLGAVAGTAIAKAAGFDWWLVVLAGVDRVDKNGDRAYCSKPFPEQGSVAAYFLNAVDNQSSSPQ